MSGYQESMTDPSFARQLITFTTAHVGNYGVSEAVRWSPTASTRRGAIMRAAVDYDDAPGAEQGWLSWLREQRHPGHRGRRHARARPPHPHRGRMRGGIFTADVPVSEARERIDAEPSMVGRDLAREVTIAAPRIYAGEGDGPRIVALDTGIKRSIIRNFTSRGATLEIYPCTTHAPRTCSPPTRTGSSSSRARATRPRSTTSSRTSARC